MGQGIGYPLNDGPLETDQILGINDPAGAWSIQRFSISQILAAVNARLNAVEIAMNENSMYPGEIVFTTNGSAFAPVIVLTVGSTATVEWTFSDGSTSNSLTPSVNFGSNAVRLQRLKVTPWEDLYRINVGYQREDGGPSTDEAGNSYEVVAVQPVTNIANLKLVQNTLTYLCGCHCPITSVDVRDFTSLYGVEFYGCGATLASADVYGTSNLRRACFENSYVGFLDFSQSPLMEDVRGSSCRLTEIRWGSTGQHLWHMCVRENSAYLDPTTWPDMTQFPVLQDCWISGNGLTNALELSSTVISSIWAYNNNHPSMDFTGAFPSGGHYANVYNNANCTEIIIDNCPGLTQLNAAGCALTQANVDYILATLDSNGATGGTLDLSGGTSAAPSAAGVASQANLEGKGWTVSVNTPAVPTLSSATIGTDGDTWTFVFNEAVEFGAGGNGGFAVTMTNAGTITLTYSSGSGSNTLVYTGDVTVQGDDTVASGLDYTQPGDGIENTSGYDLASFTGESVTNNSAVGPPALVSATLGTDGMTWTFVFNKAVSIGSGGSGGFAIEFATTGAVPLTYGSGSGTTSLVYTGDMVVESNDTVVDGLNYTQPGDGIEDGDGYDLASFVDHAIVNNSGYSTVPITIEQFDSQAWNDINAENITWEAGDTVVVFAGCWEGTPTGFSVADNNGDGLGNYTPITASFCDSVASTGWFYQRKTAAGTGTVTLTDTGGGSNYSIRTYVIAGIAETDPVEFALNVASPGLTTPAFSTGNDNVIVLFGYHHEGTAQTYQTLNEGETWDNNSYGGPVRPCAHYLLESAVIDETITLDFGANGYSCAISVIGLTGASQVADTTAPTLQSATIGEDGLTWTLTFDGLMAIGAGGAGGLAVSMASAGTVNLTYVSGGGTDTLVFTGDVTVSYGDTVSSGLDYTQPGNGLEDESGNDLQSFSDATVTNNSDVNAPPTLTSATIGADGDTWTFQFDRNVQVGAGGSGGFAVTMTTAGAITLTYTGGSGTNALTYSGSATVDYGDTVSSGLDYTQPGNGIEASTGGVDLVTFTGAEVTNGSQVNAPAGRLDFVTDGTTADIELVVTGTPTITWYMDDDTVIANDAVSPGHTYAAGGEHSNYVIVDPPEAVTRINRNGSQLLDVDGCGNFPNLNYLYFYPWTMARSLDLTGCTAMRQWHLSGNNSIPTEVDDWVIEQAAAFSGIADGTISGNFYCPERTTASDAAQAIIVAKGISWS